MDRINDNSKLLFYLLILFTVLFSTTVHSESSSKPTISILIDDIGYKFKEDTRALALPGPVAYAILPHGPHTEVMSKIAFKKGKDILLHLPMQAEVMDKNEFLGPGALTLNMTREEFFKTLNINIRAVPNLIGINNHMGSLLTQHPGHMQWLMDSIKNNGQFYVDSLTSDNSVAARLARENNVPYLTRDVFLDHKQGSKNVRTQFKELIKVAKRNGSALGIGHPHASTIQVLSELLQNVDQHGVKLVSIKTLLHKSASGKKYAQRTGTTSAGM
ncbi:MAG: divergent polysaccharide deacetylase family protein [Proteobacteria bacterium]|nr:divergent polysaccharide deacetylase family protein [Pseudomonadota bacterium]NOG60191.1 divergent polysaccharide deacetylase family protein [Pseudomonadota bacterium]